MYFTVTGPIIYMNRMTNRYIIWPLGNIMWMNNIIVRSPAFIINCIILSNHCIDHEQTTFLPSVYLILILICIAKIIHMGLLKFVHKYFCSWVDENRDILFIANAIHVFFLRVWNLLWFLSISAVIFSRVVWSFHIRQLIHFLDTNQSSNQFFHHLLVVIFHFKT